MTSQPPGHVELDRTVESIRVGRRHRADLGDIAALASSIGRAGLLQPITITPDGLLVCGARRLAAIKRLGWRTVSVWVRSGISDQLGQLLAEQDDNQLHKALSPLEAAGLYREIKHLIAEDAARREQGTRFTPGYQPRWNGPGNFPSPLTPTGPSRQQAAGMIPGAPSYRTLDKIEYLQRLAQQPDTPPELRDQARQGLADIEAGGPVHPVFEHLRALQQEAVAQTDAHLHELAEIALARAKTAKAKKTKVPGQKKPAVDGGVPVKYPVRAFVLTWTELDTWWEYYDLDELAARLSVEQAEAFYAVAEGTARFAAALRDARDEATARPHLRAL